MTTREKVITAAERCRDFVSRERLTGESRDRAIQSFARKYFEAAPDWEEHRAEFERIASEVRG